MASVKLSKLLLREETLNAVKETEKALGTNIAIEDAIGVIYGSLENLSEKSRFEIILENEVIGAVIGESKASCIAALLKAIAINDLEKKGLANETLEKYKEINILYNVSEKIATTAGIYNVSKIVLGETMRYVKSSFSSILTLDEAGESLEVVCEINKNLAMDHGKLNKLISMENNFIKDVINKKTGEIINNINEANVISSEKGMLSSLICNPIVVKNKVLGIMVIGNDTAIEYNSSDLKLCNSLAFQAGVAIEGAKLYDSLRENFFDTVQILSQIIEMRDSYKGSHAQTVVNYSLNIGRAMGLPKMELVKLKLAVLLHDIGNVGISDEILNKKGKLTDEEYDIVKKHSETGANMLKNIDQLKDIISSIKAHHERYDGTGYPGKLKGQEIPLFARIIAVADAFEAMTNNRPYREAMNLYFAEEELINNKETQFDPKVVEAFFKVYKDKNLEEMKTYVYGE